MKKRWFLIFRTVFVINFKEFTRDTIPLFFSLIMPSIFLIVFGVVGKIGVHDQKDAVIKYLYYVVPALLAYGMVNLCLFGTASPLVNAKERGILKQYMLIPMPLSAMMSSHICVRLVVALIQGALLLAIAQCFAIRIEGNGALLIIVYAFCATTLIAFGYALAGLLKTATGAAVLFLFLNFYILAFGQIFTDMRHITFAKWLIYTTPVAFVSDSLRETMLNQSGALPLWLNLIILAGWLLLAYWIGIRRFKFLPETP